MSLWNSKNRYGIDTNYETMKFKTIFPTFKKWKIDLINYGVKETKIKSEDFLMIESLIGNAYLLYNVDTMNIATTAFNFKKLDFIRDRTKNLTSLSIDELMGQTANNQTINYVINQIKEPINYDKFVNGSNKMIHKSQDAKINKLNEINKFSRMLDPDLIFLIRLMSSIILPIQPLEKGWKNE